MAAAIQVSAEISNDTMRDLQKAMAKYQKAVQRDNKGILRSSCIDIVKSLRKQTKAAPKKVPRADVRLGEHDPKYYTGKKENKVYRRVVVKRWKRGSSFNKVGWVPVDVKYTTRMGMRNGNFQGIVKRTERDAAMIKSARDKLGRIRRSGLAKKAWGWFMQSLFNQSAGRDTNPEAVIDKGMVDGHYEERRDVLPDGTIDREAPYFAKYTMVNKLSYARKAMPFHAVEQAVINAVKSINHKITHKLRSKKFGN